MIENEVARFIIQKANVRDMYSVGAFGGNIIDAELVGHPGLDNFLEIQPALNLETVINADTLEVVNDGADGGAAIIRTCGPDDVLDFVNPSVVIEDAGLTFPPTADDVDQDVDACTEYTLEPDAAYLKVVTTVMNNDNSASTECTSNADCAAGEICSGEVCGLGMFVGDFVNAAGELDQWASGVDGIGPQLIADMGVLDWFGYGKAEGVDYGMTTIEIPSPTRARATSRPAASRTSCTAAMCSVRSSARIPCSPSLRTRARALRVTSASATVAARTRSISKT
jgi:hypothetical protein